MGGIRPAFRPYSTEWSPQPPPLVLEPIYHVPKNPLSWRVEVRNAIEHTNFFESRATEYRKAVTLGTWEEAF